MSTVSYFGLSIFLFLLASAYANIKPARRGVTLQLIHRFSPSLPFHKTDSFQNFLERNDEHFVKSFATNFQYESIDVQLITPTSRREHLFYVNLSIGEPPVTQYLAMDTGSHLIWVIGDSLKREFKYSPHRSSTHNNITCGSDACNKLGQISYCNSIGNCMCQTRYGDGEHKLESYLAYDTFVFNDATIDKVIMGINYNGKGSLFAENNFYGVLGLSPPYPSFVHRLRDLGANKFSYYINGKVTDSIHPNARLTLGDKADVQGGFATPLKVDGDHYRISLESISLGRKRLDIDARIFAQKGNEGGTGVIIDSGSIKTWLTDDAYDILSLDVGDELVKRGFKQKLNTKDFCYYGFVEQVKKSDFPILSFNFAGGASLQLDEDDLFIDSILDYFCMTVLPSSTHGPTIRKLTIIGLTAQQDYIMGYDLDNQRLAIKLSNL